jgi:hypothetical protein
MFDPADKDIARKIWNWIRTFSIAGPGVTMKNTGDSCTIFVSQLPGQPPPGPRLPAIVNPTATTYTPAGGSPVTLARGWYKGNVWKLPTSPPTLTSQITQASLGTAGTSDIIIADPSEIAATGTVHINLTGTFQPLLFLALPWGPADSAGTPLYVLCNNQGKVCP